MQQTKTLGISMEGGKKAYEDLFDSDSNSVSTNVVIIGFSWYGCFWAQSGTFSSVFSVFEHFESTC